MDLIKNIVLEYVNSNSKNHYALMITGEWGSGKTYYFKEILKAEIEATGKNILYISLNGVSSPDEIHHNILGEKLKVGQHFTNTITGKLLYGALKSFTTIADKFTLGTVTKLTENFEVKDLTTLFDFSKNVIFFDDLERVSNKFDFADVLGFINSNFVEHEGVKVIIICNENEIISKGHREGVERYKEDEKRYNRIKEKLIGRTLTFSPDIKDIIENIIASYEESDKAFYRFLMQHNNFIVHKIFMSKENNIRSVLFMFDNLKTITEKVEEAELNIFSNQLILSAIILSFEEKKGELSEYNDIDSLPIALKYDSNNLYTKFVDTKINDSISDLKIESANSDMNNQNKFSKDYLKDKYWGSDDYFFFPSIFHFIKKGFLDEGQLNEEINKLIPAEQTFQIQVLNKIKQSLALDDDDFKKSFDQLMQYIKSGEYNLPEFIEAAQALHFFSSVGIIPDYPKEVLNQFLIEHIDQTRPNSSPADLLSIKRAMGSRTPQFHDSKDLLDKIESIIELLKNEEKEKIIDNNLQKIKNSDYTDITKDEFREIIRYHSLDALKEVIEYKYNNSRERLAVIQDLFYHAYYDVNQPWFVLQNEAENLNKLLEWATNLDDSISQDKPISKYWILGFKKTLEEITQNMHISDHVISDIDL